MPAASQIMRFALEVLSILVIGWIAGAESGSWCCVQPVVERLPYEQQVAMEQGMLRTFGRLMPILMPLSGVLAIALAFWSRGEGAVFWWRVATATCIAVATITTLAVNVPINTRTGSWQLAAEEFSHWAQMRSRWHFYQGVRAGLFTAAFAILAVTTVVTKR